MKIPPMDSPELAHISPAIRGLAFPVADLIADPENSRTHGERNRAAIRASLVRFGQRKTIFANRRNRIVETGNGRLEIARELGWKWIAVAWEDDDAVTAAGYAIADNRTAELASWDYEGLALQVEGLLGSGFEVADLGFSTEELLAIAGQAVPPPPASPGDEPPGGYEEPPDNGELQIGGIPPEDRDAIALAVRGVLEENYPNVIQGDPYAG